MTGARRTYHHGNLRATLVETALGMLEKTGSLELSLRGVAAAAGVSRMAPYAHFQDKRALLTAIANSGFDHLAADALEAANSAPDAEACFLGIGRAYIHFALDHPNLFKLMFSGELGSRADLPAIEGSKTYALFRESFAALLRERPSIVGIAAIETIAWSMIHGLSLLLIEERLPVAHANRDEFIEQVTSGFAALLDRQ